MSAIRAGQMGEETMTRARRRDGFTILEIMIATAILTLGLVGILALFPVAIHTGKQIVEKSTAVVVAESVAEAIREGIRNQLRYSSRSGDAYFLFRHDGVKDRIPLQKKDEKPTGDYYILLPGYGRRTTFSGRQARQKALEAARTYVYPETDRRKNGNGRASQADNDGDDYTVHFVSSKEVYTDVLVEQTYSLGNLFPDENAEPGENILADQQIEALKQFSYAFAISPSIEDANRSPTSDRYEPMGRLFHVRVMIFRSFMPPVEGGDPPTPIFELDFEVAI